MNLFSLPLSIGANAFFSALLHWEAIGAESVVSDVIGKAITGTTASIWEKRAGSVR